MIKADELLKNLTDGFSNYAKLANRFWGLLIVVVIFSTSNYSIKQSYVNLPFGLSSLNQIDFHLICLLMMCGFSIAFVSSYLQSIRVRDFIDVVVKSKKDLISDNLIGVKDYVDSILISNNNRVAPISQYLQDKSRFFGIESPPLWIKYFAIFFYCILKISAFIIVFLFPILEFKRSVSFYCSHKSLISLPVNQNIVYILVFVTVICFIIAIIADIFYFIKALQNIFIGLMLNSKSKNKMNELYAKAQDEILSRLAIEPKEGEMKFENRLGIWRSQFQHLQEDYHIDNYEIDIMLQMLVENNYISVKVEDEENPLYYINFKGLSFIADGGFTWLRKSKKRDYLHKRIVDYFLALGAIMASLYYGIELVKVMIKL